MFKSNGRVDIHPDTIKQFSMYDKIPAKQPSAYRDALQGNLQDSPLSCAFFSKENIQILQNGIRAGVYNKSKGQYLIGPQEEDSLKIVMRSTFLTYSANMPNDISQQIKSLNNIVLDYCVNQVYGEAQGYLKYIQDASTLAIPMDRPIYSSNEGKTLELKKWF
jgi:hypothetical protein